MIIRTVEYSVEIDCPFFLMVIREQGSESETETERISLTVTSMAVR